MKIVILGLSYTSSWGNGHATTYRGLVRELAARGHEVVFLERDMPWYAAHRDAPTAPVPTQVHLYSSIRELKKLHARTVRSADAVIVGSYVPDGIQIGEWVLTTAEGVTAFYDIDTPVTLASLQRGECAYLNPELIAAYRLYLSFTGGPILKRLEKEWNSPMARPLYCSVDQTEYYPEKVERLWDLGYLGTYSPDRQPALDRMLVKPAKRWGKGRFVVAGAMYPEKLTWPKNVQRFDHLAPGLHRQFYNQQRFTLNVTRADMIAAGYSPSVRLFEAAACGTPIISDTWPGLDEFLLPGKEILVVSSTKEALEILREMSPAAAAKIGAAARRRILGEHTAAHRAAELEGYLRERCEAAAALERESLSA